MTPEHVYLRQEDTAFLSGNQAFVRLMFEQSKRDSVTGHLLKR